MNIEWLKNKTKEKFYPITHAKAVLFGENNRTVNDEIEQIKNDLSNLKDGTTPAAKAVADEDGNNIKSTYVKKTEVPSGSIVDSELSETSVNPVQNKIVTAKLNEVFQSVSNGKSLIASAITDKGITTAADATFQVMATNIGKISSGSDQSISNVLYAKSCNSNIFKVLSKIKLSENPTVSNISLYINDTLFPITEFTKINDYEFHLSGDFSALSENDSVVISTNSGLYFDSNITSYNVLAVVLANPIFELPKPQLYNGKYVTQLYTQFDREYYAAVNEYNNDDDYFAISMIAIPNDNWVFPIVVSNNANYAHATTSYNFGTLNQNYVLEYDGNTYYFSYEISGSYPYSISDVPSMGIIVPLYPYDGGFSNNLEGGKYIATKLLNLYYKKEDMPDTIILPTTAS